VIILSTCVERRTRLTRAHRTLRWVTATRIEQGFWGFRVRCAAVVLKNV
jgi:hypothetical protein